MIKRASAALLISLMIGCAATKPTPEERIDEANEEIAEAEMDKAKAVDEANEEIAEAYNEVNEEVLEANEEVAKARSEANEDIDAAVDEGAEEIAEAVTEANAEIAEAEGDIAEAQVKIEAAKMDMVSKQAAMGMLYGEDFRAEAPIPVKTLVASPDLYNGKTVVTQGQIRQVCQKKGCWFELTSGAEANKGIRVTTKGDKILIPIDSAGKMATVKGVVEVREVSEEEAEHYRSEGATAMAGKEMTIYFTGVALK